MQWYGMKIVVDGSEARMDGPFSAADVLRLGGIVDHGIVIRIDGGRASHFAPGSPVGFHLDVRPAFRTFRGTLHRLHVAGLRWDWGSPAINEEEIRSIAGIGGDARIVAIRDEWTLRRGVVVDLTTIRPPRFVFRNGARA